MGPLNEMAQELRLARGELGDALEVAGTRFNVGDRVMTRVNTPEVSNRERWEVIAVDGDERSLVPRRLGAYPEDPRSARAWDDGADLICAHRLRYGITSTGGDPLGPRLGAAERRHERQVAPQRLERIQRQLEHDERVQTAERSFEIELWRFASG